MVERYMTERITNISELEALISRARINAEKICLMLEKENPPMQHIGELANQMCSELKQAHDFDFRIERRMTEVVTDV